MGVVPKTSEWNGPEAALTVIHAEGKSSENPHDHHYAVRTRRWRYILYNNGSEELYDHDSDPYEWTNLAGESQHAEAKADLKRQLLRMTGQ